MFYHLVKFEVEKDWIEQLMSVSLTINQTKKLGPKLNKFTTRDQNEKPKVSRMDLVLSPAQLLVEGFKFPFSSSSSCLSSSYETITPSLDSYTHLSDASPLYGLDCEMCLTKRDILEVTRFSLVDEDLNVILDTLVKPSVPIKNYLTQYSGITKKILDPIKTSLEEVKAKLKTILPKDAILCGHSLNSDLKALSMFHPYIIDTSVIFNSTGHRQAKTSLKNLSYQYLGEIIQNQLNNGHNSIEDAMAALKLVKLKIQKGLKFGDYVLDKNPIKDMPVVSFERYIKIKSSEVKIFYDYCDLDACDKFVTIVSHASDIVKLTIRQLLLKDKGVCLVLTRSGYGYIKV